MRWLLIYIISETFDQENHNSIDSDRLESSGIELELVAGAGK